MAVACCALDHLFSIGNRGGMLPWIAKTYVSKYRELMRVSRLACFTLSGEHIAQCCLDSASNGVHGVFYSRASLQDCLHTVP